MIRPATRADAATILAFVRELAEYERLSHECVATIDDIERTLFGPDPAANVLLAIEGDEPVGFALWFRSYSTFLGRPGVYLEDLYVRPSARGRGYGKALLRELAAICVAEGYGRLEWSVLDWNAPSIAFYESLGAHPRDGWTVMRVDGDGLANLASGGRV